MGAEDIKASLKFIMNLTREKKLSLICTSFGCNLFFIALSTFPELNSAIDVIVAFAPTASVFNSEIPIKKIMLLFHDQFRVFLLLFKN